MTTDITELAQREKFEAWFKSSFHPDKTGPYIKDQLYFAWKAAGAELVEALEKAQQVDEELCRLLPPGAEYMDPPDGGDVTPLEGVRRMVADYRQRIADLESRTVTFKLPFTPEPSAFAPWVAKAFYQFHKDTVKSCFALFSDSCAAAGIKVEAE
ncbi:hypothetical protein M8363_06495 [Klebsiella quasivariicola]|uniref:hypothetical protein n=1 Tax=Klebsiella quasivariicola TaxID=2026240 RepID=UPI002020200E|nr:hypothetical protein [Klebsiella quasivariicola]MCL7686192.1 hypothetical protein [Klebsiella quasivariicola]